MITFVDKYRLGINSECAIFTKHFALAPASQAQCEHGRQKYKDLYGNPDKKLKDVV